MLVLARRGVRSPGSPRRGDNADGRARPTGQRRRPLRRGDRRIDGRIPRQLPSRSVPSGAHQRGGLDRGGAAVIWGALVGGLAGTVVLTTVLRASSELGLTRMDIPFLLGEAV